LKSLENYGDPRGNKVWDHEENLALEEIVNWVSEGKLFG
jgi:hypothetical protein